MKKKLVTILGLAVLTLVACKKDEEVVVTPAGPGSAVLEGTIYAPLDLSNDTTINGSFIPGLHQEFAPEGTKITAIIDSEDLQTNPQPGYNYQKLKYTTTIGENGRYKFGSLPAINQNIAVELRFNDFEATQIQFDPSNNPSQEKIFTVPGGAVVVIYNGGTIIKEYEYTAN